MKENTREPGRTVSGSRLDLPAIKKLCEAATHEPWAVFYDEGLGYGIVSPDWEMGYVPYDAADFIAAARTLVPQLVEALEEAQGKLEAVRRAIDAASDSGQYSLALVEIGSLLDLDRILKGRAMALKPAEKRQYADIVGPCSHNHEDTCAEYWRRVAAGSLESVDSLRAENARLQEMQGCSACKAIHYLHPNAKVGATCGRCGEMWPCDVTELREGYARLQTKVEEAEKERDDYGKWLDEMTVLRDRYKARSEEAVQRGVELWKVLYHYTFHSRTVRRLLAEAKALAERRKEALEPEHLAQAFHEAYEELAPQFGYKTREASAVPWADVPENNKALMIAACERVARAAIEEED
ncbi:hypothetical protein LCGC14_1778860 [marine sediment metagenome]|uniref:Uncharacterized protein n=1 Tax=marine sediment metagenome TaxID=412755 RepID=A0A0F9JVP0_9ZZZZ